MTARTLLSQFAGYGFLVIALFAQAQESLTVILSDDPKLPANYRLAWPAMTGRSYEVRQSADLVVWTVAPGAPVVADGPELTFPVTVDATARFFRVTALEIAAPDGMVLIPAGPFEMGDSLQDWPTDSGPNPALPVHTVQVSGFYMDQNEVTKTHWNEVLAWAVSHGYTDLPTGGGKAADHPVQTVSWWDAVKWSNARSEKSGLTPAYYTDAAQTTVYRKGTVAVRNEWVKWRTGYRLPTEAEWEKAARGGLQGKRFPWGDTISHTQANFYSWEGVDFDLSPTRGYHPAFAGVGVSDLPYTSPARSFEANGYGLYDMAGNVWEWCWDWWSISYYPDSSNSDPHGPDTGTFRALRGGAWFDVVPRDIVTSYRSLGPPSGRSGGNGFRLVLAADSPR